MGLSITCGIYADDYISFDIGYVGFMQFRWQLAEAYNYELGILYRRWTFGSLPYTPEKPLKDFEFDKMKELAGDLMILLGHSDCEGNILPKESRKLYKALENVHLDYGINPSYHGQGEFNVLEKFKEILLYSWKKRRRIIFS